MTDLERFLMTHTGGCDGPGVRCLSCVAATELRRLQTELADATALREEAEAARDSIELVERLRAELAEATAEWNKLEPEIARVGTERDLLKQDLRTCQRGNTELVGELGALRTQLDELKIRTDLDALGGRERESIELVELRAAMQRIRELPLRSNNVVYVAGERCIPWSEIAAAIGEWDSVPPARPSDGIPLLKPKPRDPNQLTNDELIKGPKS